MLPRKLDDLQRQLGQRGQHQPFTLDFAVEPAHLLRQCAQKEDQPGLPIRRLGPDRSLHLPQREVIGLLVLLDHAFE